MPHMALKDHRGMESVNPVQRPAPTMDRPRESARRVLGGVWRVTQVSGARGTGTEQGGGLRLGWNRMGLGRSCRCMT